MMKEFAQDLDELLHATPYMSVDILPLIKKYTEGKNQGEISGLKMTIRGLIHQYKDAGWIDGSDDFHAQLSWQRPTHIEGIEEPPILIRSTLKFEEEYRKRHLPPPQPTYSATFNEKFEGNFNQGNSSGLTQSVTKESEESKELTNKLLEDFPKTVWYRRQGFIWLVVGVVLTAIAILIALT